MEPKNKQPLFTILHFNDVYDIQPNKKGNGGIVNFQTNMRKLKQKYPKHTVLFSGDCFSPSILTNIYEGKQMVKALNTLGIEVACYGNHQFDFDPETTEKLATSCNFPWLLGNIKYKSTQFNLGNGAPYLIKQMLGLKFGIFGVAGQDWLGILVDNYQDQLQYHDVFQHSKKMCKLLRQQNKCDIVIALTHMRVPQDKKLPLFAPDIDIILGGHDHIIMNQFINGIPVIKSGDNFKTIGIINVYKKGQYQDVTHKCKNYDFDINIELVPIAQDGIDRQLKQYVEQCMRQYSKNDSIVGFTQNQLDTRFSNVRTKQTNYGNFVADLVRQYYDTDCAVINSGSIRNDTIIKSGQLNYSMLSNLINDILIVKQVPGKTILQMLQYSCSNLPNTYAGSFLLVSGIKYSYDYRKHPRIQSVQIAGQPLNIQRNYSMATFFYLSTGGDGFSMIRDCKYIVDQVSGIDLLRLLLKFFKGPQNLQETKRQLQQESACEQSNNNTSTTNTSVKLQKQPQIMHGLKRKVSVRMSRLFNMIHKIVEGPNGYKYVQINPKVDGRITSLYP